MTLPGAAHAYVTHPSLAGVWAVVRRRLERNGLAATGTVGVELDAEAARRLGGLLGRPVATGRRRLSLSELDSALTSSAAALGLVDTVTTLGGPVRDRRAERSELDAQWTRVWASLDEALESAGLSRAGWVPTWTVWLRAGVCTRAGAPASEAALIAGVPVLAALRSAGTATVSLGSLATRHTGTAHGLDDGTLTATLVLRGLAMMLDRPAPTTAAERRRLWWDAGVVTDAVSGTVITWALRPPGEHPWPRMMRDRADLELVTHLTSRELAEDHGLADGIVFATENPQVLQAAADAGIDRPLLCLSGEPSQAGTIVLSRLGERVRYHGDFDWPGVAIAGRVFAHGAQPWRFDAESYTTAVAASSVPLPLHGRPQPTPWDPRLQEQMLAHGRAVHEEALIPTLLDDLRG